MIVRHARHFGAWATCVAVAAASFLLLLHAQGRSESEMPIVRLGERVAPGGADRPLPADGDLARPITLNLDRNASEIGGVTLRLAGPARAAWLNWRRQGERGFVPGRRLRIALDSSGEERTYRINLEREEQWIGKIADLRIASLGEPARLLGVVLEKPASALRSITLRGVSLPSLVRTGRFEIPLTDDMPHRGRLEVSLGVLPELQRKGAVGCFSIDFVGAADRRRLYDRCLPSGGAEVAGWVPLGLDVDLPRRGRLSFDARVEIGGVRVDSGALWGQPMLVARRAAPGPNLFLIVVDTLRADALGVYGNREGLTPNLDALARRSVRLGALHAPAPWTLPSMASLMTGLQPQVHGAGRRNGTEAPTGLSASFQTFAETLAAQGVYTSGIYKNIYLNPEFGLDQGFDTYASHEVMPAAAGGSEEANAGYLVDRSIAELSRLKDRRFFLYLHLFDPHSPYEAPREWCERIARRLEPGAASGALDCRVDRRPENPMPAGSDFARIRRLYDTEVAYTDHELGRLFAALQKQGLDQNTVVAFASDHGEEFYDRADQEHRLGYVVNSDHGHTTYEELLHVPALISAPGLAPGVVADPVQTVDLFATLLALLGVAAPTNEGQDLSAVLAGAGSGRADAPRPKPEPLVASVILRGPERRAVRRAQWKLIQSRKETLPIELYDLSTDPGETENLAAVRPDVVAGLRKLLARQIAACRSLRLRLLAVDSVDPTFLDWGHVTKLRSLGYLR